MAIANEIAWRSLTTDQWVSFKAVGIPVLSLWFWFVIFTNNAKTSNQKRLIFTFYRLELFESSNFMGEFIGSLDKSFFQDSVACLLFPSVNASRP